jgi:peptidoglycan hydrolase-like protein with peptidoglycan-binding domain
LQTRLNAWRAKTYGITLPPLVVDGDFGPKTDAMVREFQRRKGLVVDGIAGALTWGALLAS